MIGKDDAFSPDETDCLQTIEELTEQKNQCERQIRKLREQENPARGVFFHREIHTLLQEKLRISVNLRIYQNKIGQMRAKQTLQ